MNVRSPLEEQVGQWVDEHWSTELTLREWWRLLYTAGWSFPQHPEGFGGRGIGSDDARSVLMELGRHGVVGPPSGVGQHLGAPTLLSLGSRELQAELLPSLGRGEDLWVQLFSEPGSGSDLASLSTRAVRDGDEYVVNGQKVWSSGAQKANRGMLLTRTDPDVPKHRGISYFVIDLDQPGVEIRPMPCMNGDDHFCEVFLDEARVPAERLVGELNDGWRVANATLGFERFDIGRGEISGLVAATPGEQNGLLDQTVGAITAAPPRTQITREFYPSVDDLIALARRHGRADDPVVRQLIAEFHSRVEVMRLTSLRTKQAIEAGREPGPEALTTKLAVGENIRRFRDFGLELLGPAGGLLDGDAPDGGELMATFLWSFAGNIGGGTDEIQRNIIGERALGLPREPSSDRDVPYRNLKVGTQR